MGFVTQVWTLNLNASWNPAMVERGTSLNDSLSLPWFSLRRPSGSSLHRLIGPYSLYPRNVLDMGYKHALSLRSFAVCVTSGSA